jgi:hypothetical protein
VTARTDWPDDKLPPAEITQSQAAAIMAALRPLVHLAFESLTPVDVVRFAELGKAGAARLHVSAILSTGPMRLAVVPVVHGEAGDALAVFECDGGGLTFTPEGVKIGRAHV